MRLLLLALLLLPLTLHAQLRRDQLPPGYKPNTSWGFKYKDEGMNAVFIADAFKIILEDRSFRGSGSGMFVVAGPERAEHKCTLGITDIRLSWEYFNTVTKMTLAGVDFEIIENGKTLRVDERLYSLVDKKPPTLVLRKDGTLRLQGATGDPAEE